MHGSVLLQAPVTWSVLPAASNHPGPAGRGQSLAGSCSWPSMPFGLELTGFSHDQIDRRTPCKCVASHRKGRPTCGIRHGSDARGGWAGHDESACWRQGGSCWQAALELPRRKVTCGCFGRCLLSICAGLTWFSVSSGVSSTTSPSYTSLFSLMRKPAQVVHGAITAGQVQHQQRLAALHEAPCRTAVALAA